MKFKVEKKEELIKGVKETWLAKNVLGISSSFFYSLINGNRNCSYKVAKKLIDYLDNGKDVSYYFTKVPRKKRIYK